MSKSCRENQNQADQKCSICKKTNHTDKNCYFRNKNNKKEEEAKVASLTTKTDFSDSWIVDSGCTSNMTKSNIQQMKKITTTVGVAKTSVSMDAKGIGKMEFDKYKMEEVLYVPQLSANLLSVHAITKNDGVVIFTKNAVQINHKNKTIMEGEKLSNGLFQIKLKAETKQDSFIAKNLAVTDAEQWHKKLGHLSYKNLGKLTKLNEGIDLKLEDLNQEKICSVCHEAKQTRIKFGEERNRATRSLQIVHTDLCGPINPSTWDKRRYFLTFMDDYTHFTMAFLLGNKHEVPDKVKECVEKWKPIGIQEYQN